LYDGDLLSTGAPPAGSTRRSSHAIANVTAPQVVLVTRHFLCSVCSFALDGYLLGYFDHLYEDIPMGPAATFTYADGSTHEDLWMSLASDTFVDRRRAEEDEALRAQIEEA
jgi:hypothetical protein